MLDTSEAQELNLDSLPAELLLYILSYLQQEDLVKFSFANRDLLNFVRRFQGNMPLISAINAEIIEIGYSLPKFVSAYVGIQTYDDQVKFLNLIRKHKEIRRALFASWDRISTNLLSEIESYLQSVEKTFELQPSASSKQSQETENSKVQKLENYLKDWHIYREKRNAPLIYNSILLRIYIELLKTIAVARKPDELTVILYRKLFFAILLFEKIGDKTIYFALADILNKSVKHNKHELLGICKIHFGNPQLSALDFMKFAFTQNGIFLDKLFPLSENQKVLNAFLEQFDYTLAFFHSKRALTLLKDLIRRWQSAALIYFTNIPRRLLQVLLTSEGQIITDKIFTELPNENLHAVKSYFDKHKEQGIDVFVALMKHKNLFVVLPLRCLLSFSRELIDVIKSVPNIFDTSCWDVTYIALLMAYITKLKRLPHLLSFWSGKDIKVILEKEKTPIFTLLAGCKHSVLLLSKLDLNDILLLAEVDMNGENLLKLLCEEGNKLVLTPLLSRENPVSRLIEEVTVNPKLKQLLLSHNASWLLKCFPGYFQALRRPTVSFDKNFEVAIKLAADQGLVRVVDSLCEKNLSLVASNIDILFLLENDLLREYIAMYQLTFQHIRTNYNLFIHLFNCHPNILHHALRYMERSNPKQQLPTIISSSLWQQLSACSFGWEVMIYLTLKDIEQLRNILIQQTSLLTYLLNESNKRLFHDLVLFCKTSLLVDDNLFLKGTHLPSPYAIDTELFCLIFFHFCISGKILQQERCQLQLVSQNFRTWLSDVSTLTSLRQSFEVSAKAIKQKSSLPLIEWHSGPLMASKKRTFQDKQSSRSVSKRVREDAETAPGFGS